MTFAHIQRWALTLSAYNHKIQFNAGLENNNADLLSHLPLPETPANIQEYGETVLLMGILNSSAVTATQVKFWTAKDPISSQVREAILQNNSIDDSDELNLYKSHRSELSIQDGCLLWGIQVIIPPPGICKMKSLARSYVWWPHIYEPGFENLGEGLGWVPTF